MRVQGGTTQTPLPTTLTVTPPLEAWLTWSMLSGMNSPSLLMLVKDPLRATWCNSSGMYPGGGELRSLLVGPQGESCMILEITESA